MKTITLKIDGSVSDNFLWLLRHFSDNELTILEQADYVDDDTYLRSIEGMVQSIQEAREDPIANAKPFEQLDW